MASVFSDRDLTVAAFAHFVEQVPGEDQPEPQRFALPPLWPMVMEAARSQYCVSLDHLSKLLQRFNGRLTEIDLSRTAHNHATACVDIIAAAPAAVAAVKILRGPPYERRLLYCGGQWDSLEELYNRGTLAANKQLVLPRLRAIRGIPDNRAPLLVQSPLLEEVAFGAYLELDQFKTFVNQANHLRSITVSDTGDGAALATALSQSTAAPRIHTLGNLKVDAAKLPQLCLALKALPNLTDLTVTTAADADVGEIAEACPAAQLRVHCRGAWPSSDLSIVGRLRSLSLDFTQPGSRATLDELADESRPDDVTLETLTVKLSDGGSELTILQQTAFVARLVHPGLKSLLLTINDPQQHRLPLSPDVFRALTKHGPSLRSLALVGRCDTPVDIDAVLQRCGSQLQTLCFDANFPTPLRSKDRETTADVSARFASVGRRCPKLQDFQCRFDVPPTVDAFVDLVRSCRRLEALKLECPGTKEFFQQIAAAATALVQRRNLCITVKNGQNPAHGGFFADVGA